MVGSANAILINPQDTMHFLFSNIQNLFIELKFSSRCVTIYLSLDLSKFVNLSKLRG